MVRRGWRSADVPDGWAQVIRGPRPRSVQWPRASQQSRPVPVQHQPHSLPKNSPVVKTSGTRPFGDPQVRVTAAQEKVAKLEAALAALHGVDGPEVESLRAALKRAKEVKVQPVDVQIKECEGFLSRARAHLAELDAKRTTVNVNIHDAEKRLEALQQMQQFSPPPPVDAEAELRQLREKVKTLFPIGGRVAGVDRSKTGRPSRCNVVGETRRGRHDQQHHGSCSTTVAARSCSWDDAFDGDQHCELRSTYGLRGVRVGEASHPGPVQTRNTRRLLSTQIDPDDDPPVRSGRFAPLSSDSDGENHDVHVCRAPTGAINCGRVAVLSSRIVPSAPKRLRLTSRNLHRMSQASTVPGPSQSLCDALEFDLTREDSDRDLATRLDTQLPESDATPSLDGVDRPVGNSGQRFVPWSGGTPSPQEGDVAHVQAVEARNWTSQINRGHDGE